MRYRNPNKELRQKVNQLERLKKELEERKRLEIKLKQLQNPRTQQFKGIVKRGGKSFFKAIGRMADNEREALEGRGKKRKKRNESFSFFD